MAGKRGVVLIFTLLVSIVLYILLGSFFLKSINENNLVRRYVNSVRAFWLAEAGIAEAKRNMPNSIPSTALGTENYTYNATTSHLQGEYYQVVSTGSVMLERLPKPEVITRSLTAILKTNPVNPDNFQHAIRTTVDLVVKGNVRINGPYEENASFNFPSLFNYSKEDLKSSATHLYSDPPNNVTPVEGITWVDISPGGELRIASNTWAGSGILVVNGDMQITGGTFNGIIYVIGKLRMSGNPIINGSILVESDTELVEDTTLTGKVTINYDSDAIANVLDPLKFISPEIVSWCESIQ
ncbi:MAG: hypothetical protein NC928_00615 [Candidatus Omnitrophica bacterium]|nr:hypothetical protein [Candidatus Omnitrophota bacterium]